MFAIARSCARLESGFLRVPLDNLRLDSDTPLRFQFEGAVYAPTGGDSFFMRNERPSTALWKRSRFAIYGSACSL